MTVHPALADAPEWVGRDGRAYRMVEENYSVVARTPQGRMAGFINWGPASVIGNVSVLAEHQRNGLATEMLRRAREIDPDLRHSERLSRDATAWLSVIEPHALARLSYVPQAPEG